MRVCTEKGNGLITEVKLLPWFVTQCLGLFPSSRAEKEKCLIVLAHALTSETGMNNDFEFFENLYSF